MSIGPWQIIILVALFVVFFGSGKIPKLMKEMAMGIRAFKKGLEGADASPEPGDEKKENAPNPALSLNEDSATPINQEKAPLDASDKTPKTQSPHV